MMRKYPYWDGWWDGFLGWIFLGIVIFIIYFWWLIAIIIVVIGLGAVLMSMFDFIKDEFDQQNREVAQARTRPVRATVANTPAPKRRIN